MIQSYGLRFIQILPALFSELGGVDPLSLILSPIAGLLAGFLINYLADVLPQTRRLSQPKCPECDVTYKDKNYLLLRKCPNCGHQRSLRTCIVLIGSITASILLQFFPLASLSFLGTLPLLIFLGTVLVIDIEHRLVLAETSLFGIFLCLFYGLIFRSPANTFLGGMNGLLIMLFFFVLGILFGVVVGKLQGMTMKEVAFGFGDVTAGTFLGLLTGWPGILVVIVIALLSFALFSILLLLVLFLTKRYKAFTNAQPFVPFLIFGTIVLFYL